MLKPLVDKLAPTLNAYLRSVGSTPNKERATTSKGK